MTVVSELHVMLIRVEFPMNVVISFLKQSGSGSRPETHLEPTRTRWTMVDARMGPK